MEKIFLTKSELKEMQGVIKDFLYESNEMRLKKVQYLLKSLIRGNNGNYVKYTSALDYVERAIENFYIEDIDSARVILEHFCNCDKSIAICTGLLGLIVYEWKEKHKDYEPSPKVLLYKEFTLGNYTIEVAEEKIKSICERSKLDWWDDNINKTANISKILKQCFLCYIYDYHNLAFIDQVLAVGDLKFEEEKEK